MKLTPVMQKFVLHWGEMDTRWGVNRTVAQVHALLYLAKGPTTAEEITGTLGVARSNVSTSPEGAAVLGTGKGGAYAGRPARSLRVNEGPVGHILDD